MATGQSRGLEIEPLNLTPLLDVLFNLIFFFLLATTLREETTVMEVRIPQSGVHTAATPPKEEWVITIGREGELFLNQDAVTTDQLKTRLSVAAAAPGMPQPVRIRSDRDTPVQDLVTVMSIATESGHPNVSLEVREAPGPP